MERKDGVNSELETSLWKTSPIKTSYSSVGHLSIDSSPKRNDTQHRDSTQDPTPHTSDRIKFGSATVSLHRETFEKILGSAAIDLFGESSNESSKVKKKSSKSKSKQSLASQRVVSPTSLTSEHSDAVNTNPHTRKENNIEITQQNTRLSSNNPLNDVGTVTTALSAALMRSTDIESVGNKPDVLNIIQERLRSSLENNDVLRKSISDEETESKVDPHQSSLPSAETRTTYEPRGPDSRTLSNAPINNIQKHLMTISSEILPSDRLAIGNVPSNKSKDFKDTPLSQLRQSVFNKHQELFNKGIIKFQLENWNEIH